MKLTRNLKKIKDLNPLPDFSTLEFGKEFTDHMFTMKYKTNTGWEQPTLEPFANLSFSPATLVLHYAQEIFEGLKAYYRKDGKIGLFRARDNFVRMNYSAKRMSMPEFDANFATKSLVELIKAEKRWVPPLSGASLYIRPTMIATDAVIGLRPSQEYLFYIICSPVSAYYKKAGASSCLKILVEDKYVRAVAGGTGDAKTGCNYAASLLAAVEANKKGYSQVLWLDGVHRKYVEEVGTSNIFFVYKNKVVTPALNGSILPGITRASVIELLKSWDVAIEEQSLDVNEIVKDIASGKVTESFTTGTAVVVSPAGSFTYKNREYIINDNKVGKLSQKIYDELTGIQYGEKPDKFGWTTVLD